MPLMHCSSCMTPRAILGLALEGVRSNFWGLGCPSYCTAPSFGLLGFCLLFGWVTGFLCAGLLLYWISGLGLFPAFFRGPSAASPFGFSPGPPPNRSQLLASYVDEPAPSRPSRRR